MDSTEAQIMQSNNPKITAALSTLYDSVFYDDAPNHLLLES
jgi:hypothetical protein